MTADEREPSPWQRLAPVMDLVTPMAVRVAATLRLPDELAGGPRHVDELASRTGTDPDALRRVLRHLVCHGVFSEPSPDHFALNDLADLLRSDHPSGMRAWLDLDGFGGRMDLAFTGLMHTVRTGRPAWEEVFGLPFWEYLAANPEISASFDAVMAQSNRRTAVLAYDWSGVRHVADVGGGTGATLAQVLQANPHMRGTLVELPGAIGRAETFLAEQGLADRCELAAQSFFDPLPPGADVYMLSSVIHDWADEPAIGILSRCAEAAGETGRVLIVETHVDTESTVEMDLRMLVLAGGRERTPEQYGELARAAGLEVADIQSIAQGYALIDCRPPRSIE